LGTRFLPVTKELAKEMLPLVNRPIISYGVEEALASGCPDIIMITGRAKRSIEDYFDRSFELEQLLKSRGKEALYEMMLKISNLADILYVRQREPLGLGHAVLCAEDAIASPFAVVNADDYYGRSAFKTIGTYLSGIANDSSAHAMVGYVLGNTMSKSGSVSRGVCTVKDGCLDSIVENLKIYYEGEGIVSEIDGEKKSMTGKEWVSMNLFGFSPAAFDSFNKFWKDFIAHNAESEKAEALLPVAAGEIVKSGKGSIRFFTSDENWFGMTYPEDKAIVKAEIAKKIEAGYYPEKLWEK